MSCDKIYSLILLILLTLAKFAGAETVQITFELSNDQTSMDAKVEFDQIPWIGEASVVNYTVSRLWDVSSLSQIPGWGGEPAVIESVPMDFALEDTTLPNQACIPPSCVRFGGNQFATGDVITGIISASYYLANLTMVVQVWRFQAVVGSGPTYGYIPKKTGMNN